MHQPKSYVDIFICSNSQSVNILSILTYFTIKKRKRKIKLKQIKMKSSLKSILIEKKKITRSCIIYLCVYEVMVDTEFGK